MTRVSGAVQWVTLARTLPSKPRMVFDLDRTSTGMFAYLATSRSIKHLSALRTIYLLRTRDNYSHEARGVSQGV